MSSQRADDALRPITITPCFTTAPLASVLISCGDTRVMCTCSNEDRVPPFRMSAGGGWLTAEYSMLPGSTPQRNRRGVSKGKLDGRSTEIQRLIGRSLRAGFDLTKIGPRTLTIDCDVLQADGGTRTAAITGGYVAARLGLERLIAAAGATRDAIFTNVAAISVGIVNGRPMLDLDYPLDSNADVDMNVVMNSELQLIEVQGTGEKGTFKRAELDALLDLSEAGVKALVQAQNAAIARGLELRPGV